MSQEQGVQNMIQNMAKKYIKLQHNGEKYSINLQKDIIKSFNWKKGDDLEISLFPLSKNNKEVDPSVILIFNKKLSSSIGTPIDRIGKSYEKRISEEKRLEKNSNNLNIKAKRKIKKIVSQRKRVELEEQKRTFNEKYPESKFKVSKEEEINFLLKRRAYYKTEIKDVNRMLKNARRKKS